MSVTLAPGFSVYSLVERVEQTSAVFNHRYTMTVASYEIENATLMDNARTRIFSGFQRMSKFLLQIDRYKRIAAIAESVYVFGIPDVTPPPIPNIRYMLLEPNAALAKEWFLISYGAEWASVLATQEQTHIDDPDDQRVFKGIWSFDVALAAILEQWVSNAVDARPLSIDEAEHDFRWQGRIVNNIVDRLERRVKKTGNLRAAVLERELAAMLEPFSNRGRLSRRLTNV
jgi:hypothetical protein